ncbi:MAG: hypothetical protein WCL71_06840, partial [Deltaproteobacteria bacterium]
MKTYKKTTLLALAVAAVLAFAPCAFALNITISDGESNSSNYKGTGIGGEDNEVEIDMSRTQSWDLEGFFLNGKKLTMVGGFNFKGTALTDGHDYRSGDIFISTDPSYGTPIGNYGSQAIVKQTFGYEYALDINWATLAFDVVKLGANSNTQTAYYSQNQGTSATSNPWKYAGETTGTATVVGNGTGTGGGTLTPSEIAAYGVTAWNSTHNGTVNNSTDNTHYAVTFDLSSVIADADLYGKDFYTHFTMGCGNDNMIGHGTAPVPEPGTM